MLTVYFALRIDWYTNKGQISSIANKRIYVSLRSAAQRDIIGSVHELIFNNQSTTQRDRTVRGGKIGPARWASPVHPELGPGWAINYWPEKNRAKFGPTRPGPLKFFLPSKGYLARPTRFLGRAGLLKFWLEKTRPILAQPGFSPAWPGPPDCQLYELCYKTNVYIPACSLVGPCQ